MSISDMWIDVIRYCGEEVERQQDRPTAVVGMVEAWRLAFAYQHATEWEGASCFRFAKCEVFGCACKGYAREEAMKGAEKMTQPHHLSLGELITELERHDSDQAVAHGFGKSHSYRGYYDQLAFQPVENTTVGAMLRAAKEALGKTYTGYKGGEYAMGEWTDVWLANYGDTGESIGAVLLSYMLGGQACTKPGVCTCACGQPFLQREPASALDALRRLQPDPDTMIGDIS